MEFLTNNVLEVFGSHASFIFCKTLFEWVKNDPTGCKGLTNSTRWQKLPAISNSFQAIIEYITNTTKLSPLNRNPAPRHPLLFYFVLSVIVILMIFVATFFYWKWIQKPPIPLITFQLPSINTTPAS